MTDYEGSWGGHCWGWWGVNGGVRSNCGMINRECADVVAMKSGGAKRPAGNCYRAGLRLSIGFLAHACSVMIE